MPAANTSYPFRVCSNTIKITYTKKSAPYSILIKCRKTLQTQGFSRRTEQIYRPTEVFLQKNIGITVTNRLYCSLLYPSVFIFE